MYCERCATDDDFATASLFVLEHKHDLHPSFTTVDIIGLLYTYVTKGFLLQSKDAEGRLTGVLAYYHGTPENNFEDRSTAFADMVIFDKTHRGTKLFLTGLRYWVGEIVSKHPEVREIQFCTLEENAYLCKLYSKFAKKNRYREGLIGKEAVFCVEINTLRGFLKKFTGV